MSTHAAFLALGDERFVSLTTFRKTGEPVSTPVRIERDGDALVVTTPKASGKVKRVLNDPRAELPPCDRFGRVKEGTEPVGGVAEIVADAASRVRLTSMFRAKYGLEYRIFMVVERLVQRGQSPRVMPRVRPG
ncbi:MAG: PPOX class F420-dependent oxidoreductase [Chloroflexia bacterium]|nr:PPOX class F420-dependent oxidoreductase [Chloroflexia bacterium]